MSIKALNWCRDLEDLPGIQKSVLRVICDRYNENYGYAWPSIARIAKETGWSVRSVKRAVTWLESRGLVAVYRQFQARDLSWGSNRYYLPVFGDIPPKGKKFILQGDFDYTGKWDPTLEYELDPDAIRHYLVTDGHDLGD